ncbi:GDSL esterase/lipase At3g26430 [Linum perenne]
MKNSFPSSLPFISFFFYILIASADSTTSGRHLPCDFPAIFNFGDSNSDTGGLSAAFGQAGSPAGETFFHHPAGRYSDGRLVIDFIGGVYSKLLPKPDHFTRALYTFDIGQNDLTSAYFLNMTTPQVMAQIPDVLAQFKVVLKSVYSQGGRHFWIHGTGPIGCLAYVLDRVPTTEFDKTGCAIPVNRAALWFNLELKRLVRELRRELPLAAITYVDVYSVKYELIRHAKLHGFTASITACCGYGGKYNYSREIGCGGKMKRKDGVTVEAKSCKDPSVYVNWDGVHFTEAANKWIFDQIVDGKFSELPLSMACYKKE